MRSLWRHPALVITLLILFPPGGILLAWLGGWPRQRKVLATALSAAWFFALVAMPAPDAGDDEPPAQADPAAEDRENEPAAPAEAVVADYVGRVLADARTHADEAGFQTTSHDATEGDAGQWADDNWTVCFQSPAPGTEAALGTTIDFAVVRTGEPCPASDGAAIAYPRVPDVVGMTFADAAAALGDLGLPDIGATSVYLDVDLPPDHDDWTVCFQSPREGEEIQDPDLAWADLSLAAPDTDCPAEEFTELHPAPEEPDPDPAPEEPFVYYENCDEVRAADQAPLLATDPGYRSELDADDDGVACDT